MSERERLSAIVRGRLETLSTVDASKELIRPDLGTANFEQGVPLLKMTVALFGDLRSLDMLVLPLEYLRRINQRAEVTLNWLEKVQSFTLNDSNPTGTRDSLLQELEADYDQHMTHLGAHIGYLLVKQTDFNALDAAARDKCENSMSSPLRLVRSKTESRQTWTPLSVVSERPQPRRGSGSSDRVRGPGEDRYRHC